MKSKLPFTLGMIALLTYAWLVHPPGFVRGYSGDFCVLESTRQMISEQLSSSLIPSFFTKGLMAPYGTSVAYMPWTIESSGIGSIFWNLNPDFPFFWLYFVVSLTVSYFVVGSVNRRLGIPAHWAWFLSLLFVVANISRHFKQWHHLELIFQHWMYASLFLDALIWHRFTRDRTWSWSLESWRILLLLVMLGTAGYYWGPLILEWLLVRGWMLHTYRKAKSPKTPEAMRPRLPTLIGNRRSAILAGGLTAVFLLVMIWWYGALFIQVKKLGLVSRSLGWFGSFGMIVRPLWLDDAWGIAQRWFSFDLVLPHYSDVETVVAVGWFLWIPAILGILRLRRKAGGPGLRMVSPFLLLLVIAVIYICVRPTVLQDLLQHTIPFMSFFRVTTRWGLLMPAILGCIIALSWPELSAYVRTRWRTGGPTLKLIVMLFVALSAVEVSQLRATTMHVEPMNANMAALLNGVKEAAGTTVLDLPFCVAGANGVCTAEQCPHYPKTTTGICFHGFHGKAVYGTYQSRLVPEQCEVYRKPPYVSWFDAWRTDRCLTPDEWNQFCSYLDGRPELSAILLYPDFWTAAGQPACWSQFEERLGPPIKTAVFAWEGSRDSAPPMSRVAWFAPKCRKK